MRTRARSTSSATPASALRADSRHDVRPAASLAPKAKRDYDGLEVPPHRAKPNFYYNASYTYSRLYGNWAGLANSDENGHSDPNVSRAFDLSPGNFDAQGQNVYGLLATDRPHTLKLFGNYTLDSKLGSHNLGVSQFAYSGTPLSSEITLHRAGVLQRPRRPWAGRTPSPRPT